MDNQCTAVSPWKAGADGRWSHPDAKYIKDDYGSLGSGGSYEVYECPHCGKTIYSELPD